MNRQQFLHLSAAVAAGLALPPALAAADPKTYRQLSRPVATDASPGKI